MKDEYRYTGALYDFLLSRPLRPIRFSIRSFTLENNHKRILDICCGTGEQLRLLEGNNLHLTGVDLSASMLREAKKKSNEINYLCMDWSQPQIDHGLNNIDCAIISFGLHEKTPVNHDRIFLNTFKVVRPGGHILLCDFCTVGSNFSSRIFGQLILPSIERAAGRTHFNNYRNWMRTGALEGFCDRHGFSPQIVSSHFNNCVNVCLIQK